MRGRVQHPAKIPVRDRHSFDVLHVAFHGAFRFGDVQCHPSNWDASASGLPRECNRFLLPMGSVMG